MADCCCSVFIPSICQHPAQQIWLFSFCYFVFCEVSQIILLSQSILQLQDIKQRNRLFWTRGLCSLGYYHFPDWLVDLPYCKRKWCAGNCSVKGSLLSLCKNWERSCTFTKYSQNSGNSRNVWSHRHSAVFSLQSSHLRNKWPERLLLMCSTRKEEFLFLKHTTVHVGYSKTE